MRRCTHGMYERLEFIRRLRAEGKRETARQLAERFEVSTRTIQRDLEFIRDRVEAQP